MKRNLAPLMWRPILINEKLRWGLLLILVGLFTVAAFRFLILSLPVSRTLEGTIDIPQGASAYRVGRLLQEKGLIANPATFALAVRLKGGAKRLQPGRFQLLNLKNMGDLTRQLLDRIRPVVVTIPEGVLLRDVTEYVGVKYPIDRDHFRKLAGDEAFIASLGVKADHLEGYLFPDTYVIEPGSREEDIYRLMVNQTLSLLDSTLITAGDRLGMDAHAILTMASIIEGEARVEEERAIISAVYHNRLKKGMRLQADPTVQYALNGGQRRLYFKDYKTSSPYNTYLIKGLPPGPVNNPGEASIRAAVAPADVDYLYFVANSEGRHVFTKSMEEHEKAISEIRGH